MIQKIVGIADQLAKSCSEVVRRRTSRRGTGGRLTTVSALAVAAAITTSSTTAGAQVSVRSAVLNFQHIDTDADAKLNTKELTAAASRDFRRLDIDRDGFLTRGELARTRRKTVLLPVPGRFSGQAAFTAADTDMDQKIDRHEYVSAVVHAYMSCDGDHDGTIELGDLRQCRL